MKSSRPLFLRSANRYGGILASATYSPSVSPKAVTNHSNITFEKESINHSASSVTTGCPWKLVRVESTDGNYKYKLVPLEKDIPQAVPALPAATTTPEHELIASPALPQTQTASPLQQPQAQQAPQHYPWNKNYNSTNSHFGRSVRPLKTNVAIKQSTAFVPDIRHNVAIPKETDRVLRTEVPYKYEHTVKPVQGPQGPVGPRGPKGDDGLQGVKGEPGQEVTLLSRSGTGFQGERLLGSASILLSNQGTLIRNRLENVRDVIQHGHLVRGLKNIESFSITLVSRDTLDYRFELYLDSKIIASDDITESIDIQSQHISFYTAELKKSMDISTALSLLNVRVYLKHKEKKVHTLEDSVIINYSIKTHTQSVSSSIPLIAPTLVKNTANLPTEQTDAIQKEASKTTTSKKWKTEEQEPTPTVHKKEKKDIKPKKKSHDTMSSSSRSHFLSPDFGRRNRGNIPFQQFPIPQQLTSQDEEILQQMAIAQLQQRLQRSDNESSDSDSSSSEDDNPLLRAAKYNRFNRY